jgi:3-oxoacyl-[acyl-carrier-protein] synthase-3
VTEACIRAVAGTRPARLVPNSELSEHLETSDEWIRSRTGIESRFAAGPGESVVEMAADATAKALATAGLDPAEVDLLILATCSMPSPMPGGAPQVAARVGIQGGAVDLNACCAGFSYALAFAADSVRSGTSRTVVVTGAERMLDLVDPSERSTAVLFGDGAGSVVVTAAPEGSPRPGIGPVVWGHDGALADVLVVEPGGYLRMDGPAVYRWATTALAGAAREACAKAGVRPEELTAFVPHQANLRIVSSLARALGVGPQTVIADDVIRTANTSAASIPLALAALADADRLTAGGPVLLLGFGAGLTWAAQVVTVP